MHYTEYCPRCAPIEKKTIEYYDLFRILHRLEVERPGGEDRVWRDYLMDHHAMGNDRYVSIFLPNRRNSTVGDGEYEVSEQLMQDFDYIHEMLGLSSEKNDVEIVVWVSW